MDNMGLIGIPVMKVEGMKNAKAEACGMNNYVVTVKETSKQDYADYLKLLEQCGFEKYAQNEEGIDGRVFSATYMKGQFVLTVGYYSNIRETSISFYQHIPLSERLIYKDSYTLGYKKGVGTTLYMMQLYSFGNSFVFQLKNGHFVISDGGTDYDTPYLLDFLEAHTPKDEKPIIEGWIITHGHADHTGALHGLFDHTEWLDRIYVEGIYYSQPSEKVTSACLCGELECNAMKWVAKHLKKSNGESTGFYRPQTGQRYYFCDMTVDILLCQEQVPFEDYRDDLNAASTVCMFTIDGQKCLLSGDVHEEGFRWMIKNYSQEYMKLDFFTLNHHGFNTSEEFTDYSEIQTLLITSAGKLPVRTRRQTERLKAKCKEVVDWGDGTKVFRFPYEIGEVETLEPNQWIYHKNEAPARFGKPIYTIPGRRYYGTIFEAEGVLFEGDELLPGAREVLQHIREGGGMTSIYATCSTEELQARLRNHQMQNYFDLILGFDKLDIEELHADALLQSEAYFGLGELDKILVVGHDNHALTATFDNGFRSIIVNKNFDSDMDFMASIGVVDSIGDMLRIYEEKNAIFRP